MAVKLNELLKIFNDFAPEETKEEWDNVGLLLGNPEKMVSKMLVSLDITERVIEEAVKENADLIFTHHPVIFHGIKTLRDDLWQGRNIKKLMEKSIAVYSSHTNLDRAGEGMTKTLMEMLELKTIDKNDDDFGEMANISTTLAEFINRIRKILNPPFIRYTGNLEDKIHRLGVLNGSGSDYITKFKNNGCNAVLTGDTNYHTMLEAKEEGIIIIDAGHFSTEWPVLKEVVFKMKKKYNILDEIEIIHSSVNKDVFRIEINGK